MTDCDKGEVVGFIILKSYKLVLPRLIFSQKRLSVKFEKICKLLTGCDRSSIARMIAEDSPSHYPREKSLRVLASASLAAV